MELTWAQLRDQVARARAGLRRLGVGRGDRVVAYLPNIPETLVAFLATASLGAIWASCAPEFGARSVVDRFGQIEPTVLLAVAGYGYGSQGHRPPRAGRRDPRRACRPCAHVVHVPYGAEHAARRASAGPSCSAEPGELAFEPVPFAHPLCVLFSSGTTGKPKAIVHGHGGILLEHLKNHALSWDLRRRRPDPLVLHHRVDDVERAGLRRCWCGASIVMIDGNPLHPDLRWQWRLAAETGATLMGASPGFLMACRKEGVEPGRRSSTCRGCGRSAPRAARCRRRATAGWPSSSGPACCSTSAAAAPTSAPGIVQGSPLQPVWAGEISGPVPRRRRAGVRRRRASRSSASSASW